MSEKVLCPPKIQPSILFLGHTGALGGAELALLRVARQLSATQFSYRALFFSDGPLLAALRDAAVPAEVLPLSESMVSTSRHAAQGAGLRPVVAWEATRGVWRLARWLRAQRIALVHANSLKAGVIGGLAARLARCRFVWHLHDRLASDYLPGRVAAVLRVLLRNLPHFVIVNSRATLETIEPFPHRRCAVVYPGVDVGPLSKPLAPGRSHVIGLVGRISRTKGQDVFLRAAARVLERFPGVRFQIIGGALFNDAPFETEVRSLAATLGIAQAVEFTGFVRDVEARMAALDMLVHASPTPEPFGQVVVEGMAAGKPVVATRAGGVTEIIIDEDSGLLVPPGNADALATAICRLLADPALRVRLAERGRQRAVECFGIEQTARQILVVHARLLGVHPMPQLGAFPSSDGDKIA
jgi:glycosyltransferase involved in cell wall biosynthesis